MKLGSRHLTKEEKEEAKHKFIKLQKEGLSTSVIALRLGHTTDWVRRKIREYEKAGFL